ncbi:MAG: peptidoglycan DD-metalloendopeptidase family protein [Candidatus Accumulibacter sp.]|jgi:lipoprotein NlpD|nr:peptidoglycan DD-metalloendopeptidase family protein [Accumulibacter sp.]
MKKNDFFSGIAPLVPVIVVLGVLQLSGCSSKSPAPVVRHGEGVPTQAARSDTYTVRKGDTLYSIARERGLDPRKLGDVNGLANPDRIEEGQVLRLSGAEPDVATTVPLGPSGSVVVRPIGEARVAVLKKEPKGGREPFSEEALAAAQTGGQPVSSVQLAPPVAAPQPPEKPADKPPRAAVREGLSWIWPAGGQVLATFSGINKGIDIAGKSGDPVIATAGGKVVYTGTGIPALGKLVIIQHKDNFLSAYAHNRNILVKEKELVNQGQRIAEMGNTGADRVKLHFEIRRRGEPVDPLKYLPPR